MNDKPAAIKLFNAAVDKFEGRTVLRGVIDLESLSHLLVDSYQREILTPAQRSSIMDALKKGDRLPDMELGMRGLKIGKRGDAFFLLDPTYLIDGQQRQATILEFLAMQPEGKVRIGVLVWVNSDHYWEKARFHKLNAKRLRPSSNVTLRNMRDGNEKDSPNTAIATLYGLTVNERTFVLFERISWNQNKARGELLTALQFARVANYLHSHKAPMPGFDPDRLAGALVKAVEIFGMQTFRENLRVYWGFVDECWGIRRVHTRSHQEPIAHLKDNFLRVLAKMFSDHNDFWSDEEGNRLFIPVELRRKIAKFPINSDEHLARLAGSAGPAYHTLYYDLVQHINSGKRLHRLSPRNADSVVHEEEAQAQAAAE